MSSTTGAPLDLLADPDEVTDAELPVVSVRPEARLGPDGPSVYVLVTVAPAGSAGADWDLDAAYRVRENVRRRAAELGVEDVVVVLASGDPADAPAEDDEQ